MRQVTVTLFKYDELPTDAAKEKARQWFRQGESEFFGQFGEIWEPAETAARLLGIKFARTDVRSAKSGTIMRTEPDIRYSGFYSQGDGASFVGDYSYAKGCARNVAREFPKDTELLRIASELQALQRKHDYKLTARMAQQGHYSHSGTMTVEITGPDSLVNQGDTRGQEFDAAEDALIPLMRSFADWIYFGLRDEYEYRLADEQLEDGIRVNEYDFREDGTRSDG